MTSHQLGNQKWARSMKRIVASFGLTATDEDVTHET